MFPCTIHDFIMESTARLQSVTPDARLEAEILLAHILTKPRSHVIANGDSILTSKDVMAFNALIKRRLAHEPIAYLVQQKEFWAHQFHVTPAALIPRPETEILIEIACLLFPTNDHLSVLDLGTGCGAIALSLAAIKPGWSITALDNSWEAIALAKENASRLALDSVNFVVSDWCQAIQAQSFDFIVSNPPYLSEVEWPFYQPCLAYEPRSALVSGKEGMDAMVCIANAAKKVLKPGGYLLFEHGYQQGEKVRALLWQLGFIDIQTRQDLSGHERASFARLP